MHMFLQLKYPHTGVHTADQIKLIGFEYHTCHFTSCEIFIAATAVKVVIRTHTNMPGKLI